MSWLRLLVVRKSYLSHVKIATAVAQQILFIGKGKIIVLDTAQRVLQKIKT